MIYIDSSYSYIYIHTYLHTYIHIYPKSIYLTMYVYTCEVFVGMYVTLWKCWKTDLSWPPLWIYGWMFGCKSFSKRQRRHSHENKNNNNNNYNSKRWNFQYWSMKNQISENAADSSTFPWMYASVFVVHSQKLYTHTQLGIYEFFENSVAKEICN